MSEELKKEVEELKEALGARQADIEELKKENESLQSQLNAANKKLSTGRANNVILDPKKLRKDKNYVSGPNGVGFVEAGDKK